MKRRISLITEIPRFEFPDRAGKFPVHLSREFLCKLLITAAFSRQSDADSGGKGEVPCILPCYQGTASGDGFARDCLLQRRVSNEPVPGAAGRFLLTMVGSFRELIRLGVSPFQAN
jgi:hypothetical protein